MLSPAHKGGGSHSRHPALGGWHMDQEKTAGLNTGNVLAGSSVEGETDRQCDRETEKRELKGLLLTS